MAVVEHCSARGGEKEYQKVRREGVPFPAPPLRWRTHLGVVVVGFAGMRIQQNVVNFQVTVDDPVVVQVMHAHADLLDKLGGDGLGVMRVVGEPTAQPGAFHEFQDQPHAHGRLEELVQADNVQVPAPLHDLNLRRHALRVVHRPVLLDHLARKLLPGFAVVHQVHLARRAVTQQFLKMVVLGHQVRRDAVLNVHFATGQLCNQLLVRAFAHRNLHCSLVIVIQIGDKFRMHLDRKCLVVVRRKRRRVPPTPGE